ncbi:MAG: hypothetical protein JJ964_00610 [Rhizobiales bacterium]|nr:hypothetical protein [Hyphomicrobiales bacterium]
MTIRYCVINYKEHTKYGAIFSHFSRQGNFKENRVVYTINGNEDFRNKKSLEEANYVEVNIYEYLSNTHIEDNIRLFVQKIISEVKSNNVVVMIHDTEIQWREEFIKKLSQGLFKYSFEENRWIVFVTDQNHFSLTVRSISQNMFIRPKFTNKTSMNKKCNRVLRMGKVATITPTWMRPVGKRLLNMFKQERNAKNA